MEHTPDLLIYLYLVNDNISKENIENAIRDIVAIESMSWKKFRKPNDNTQKDAMIRMMGYYNAKIKKIHFLKQKYIQ